MNPTLDEVEETLRSTDNLPTLPSVATELIKMIRTSHISAGEVGKLLSEDPALTARVLGIVNSAYYGFPRQISNVTHSIVLLGFSKVRDVGVTASTINLFQSQTPHLDFRAFWMHSITTAIACEALARTLHSASAVDSFVAGLLHDIGKLALATCYPQAFEKAACQAHERNVLLRDAEREALGFDHAQVGRILAEQWSFSEALADAIHHHHQPSESRLGRELACLTHVADILARSVMVGSGGDHRMPRLDDTARRELSLTRDILDRTMTELFLGLKRGGAFFDLIQSGPGAAR